MKRSVFVLTVVALCGWSAGAMGQAKSGMKAGATAAPQAAKSILRCTGADGKTACTAAQARDVATGLATGKRMHKPFLVDVESVTLGLNGALDCKQTNGSACTDDQLSAVMNFTMSTHSHGGKSDIYVTKSRDMSSPHL